MKREGVKVGELCRVECRSNRNQVFDLPIKMEVIVELVGADGNVKWKEETHNAVTSLGLNYIADAVTRSAAIAAMTGMELGTSTTNPSSGDTDVITEVAGSYKDFDSGYPQRDTTSTVFKTTWAAGEATASGITEAAVKSGSATADAISRIEFTAVNKGADDTLAVTVNWRFS